MQNYNQQYQGHQRPGSTTSFASQPAPPPPPYGAPQGYTSSSQATNSQWAPPNQNTGAQWSQPQQQQQQQGSWGQQTVGGAQSGAYNPGTYGPMPGASSYTQGQQQDQPPPPPPKPEGYPSQPSHPPQQTQQSSQSWGQQNTGYQAQGQTGYGQQQGGAQQPQQPQQQQQQYNNAAPPPPSQTPGGSYFPPPQGGRPGSVYGAEQVGTFSTPQSATGQRPPSTIISPNEQQPAYIPPSLTGQGVQSYMPTNTNPMPGVYVPPPPDVPAWQQATHAPLQGPNKKFTYTKPNVDQSFYNQGYRPPTQQAQQTPQQGQYGQQGQQVQQQSQQYGQQPLQQQQQQPPQTQQPYGHQPQQHPHHQHQPSLQSGQFVQPYQPLQQQIQQQQQQQQPIPQQDQFQQQQTQTQPPPQSSYGQPIQGQQQQQPQQYTQGNQWQPTPPADQGYQQQQQQPQQHQWQPGHQAQGSIAQQYPQVQDQGIQAPKPVGHTGTTPPGFVHSVSPESQPVSPVHNRHTMNFDSPYNPSGLGRTGSVSSIAMGAIRNQQAQAENRTSSPAVAPPAKIPTPPPPRDSKEKFSALGFGGPSDWEHFGDADNEIDDEELFAAKKDGKNEPVQLDSVELPGSHPSPPTTTEEWPTPLASAAQPASIPGGRERRDTFQPTPPPGHMGNTPSQNYNQYQAPQPSQTPQHPPAQQGFVMGDAAPTQSPQPSQGYRPPSTQQPGYRPPSTQQQGFVMGDAAPTQSPQPTQGCRPPSTQQQGFVMDDAAPTQSPRPAQGYQPPPSQQGFVMDDGGWAAHSSQPQQRQQTPGQYQQQAPPPQTNAGYPMGDPGGFGHSQQNAAQSGAGWNNQAPNPAHVAELQAKDEAYEKLKGDAEKEKADLRTELDKTRADADKEKADLRAELDKLRADMESASAHADGEKTSLSEEIKALKAAEDQAKAIANAMVREKEMEVERWKEDAEGKEDTIREKDSAIADLSKELEAEKAKEPPAPPEPTPAALIPDLDPWYVGALERFIDMLRREAAEPQVENKIQIFKGFVKDASAARGLPYYDEPPQPAPSENTPTAQQPVEQPREEKRDLRVQVPEPSSDEDEPVQYSPGGRPMITMIASKDTVPSQQSFVSSSTEQGPSAASQSSTILTPTSSTDEDSNKTPIQSPPEEQPQPQYQAYKAYVPPSNSSSSSIPTVHRQSLSSATAPIIAPLAGGSGARAHDEIFFGPSPQSSSKPSSRPTTGTSVSTNSDVPVPAPLSFTPQQRSRSVTPSAPRKDPLEALKELLLVQITPPKPDSRLEEIRKKSQDLPSDFSFIEEATTKFDKSATETRKKNDAARRKRQEESEEHTDQLFNDNEISYADIGAIEDEFKEEERKLKAQEDRDEYKGYVEEVFDKIYDGLQADIKSLMDLYIETESLLQSSISGVEALSGKNDTPITQPCLELLQELHVAIETRHDKVVAAVSERDKRYRKTEVQPLYAAGNISKMKSVEKHFEKAEKEANFRAKSEKAERVGEMVRVSEEVVVSAVGTEQGEIDAIIAAIRSVEQDGKDEESRVDTIKRAQETITALKKSSKDLLTILNAFEIDLNTSVLEAEMAKARTQGADSKTISDLEREMAEGEKKLKEELERKLGVLEQDKEEVEVLIEEKQGKPKLSEEDAQRQRMKAALEEAKRRNGDL